ncbi:MAG: hypothetical protein K6C40_09190, partial [Thermoguttaceae bacterium]|nr:hypothetical protein [Thermoguttaceae bacterium]
MSNFDDFLNNLNSANQNDVPEEKEDSNLFDLNFEGSGEPQDVAPAEEPGTPVFPEEVVEAAPVETGAQNEDLFNFAPEGEASPAAEAPAEGLFNFGAQAEEAVQDVASAAEAPAEGLFNFGAQAEEAAPDDAPEGDASGEGVDHVGGRAEEAAQ